MTFQGSSAHRELTDQLERQSGVALKSKADVVAYVANVRAADLREKSRTRRTWIALRQAVLGLALVLAFLQYYLLDVYVQIISLPSITFLGPSGHEAAHQSAVELLLLLFS